MNLIEVNNRNLEREFINVPKILYRNDPCWVCPMDSDVMAQYNARLNPHLRRW